MLSQSSCIYLSGLECLIITNQILIYDIINVKNVSISEQIPLNYIQTYQLIIMQHPLPQVRSTLWPEEYLHRDSL